MKQNPLARCVAVIGSQSELARKLGVKRQVVFEWKKRGGIPRWWAMKLHDLTQIPVEDLIMEWSPETGRVREAEPRWRTDRAET